MPKLPEYGAPQAELRPLPNVQQSSVASPDLFGASAAKQGRMGQQLTQAGEELNKIAVDMQNRENLDAVFSRSTAIGNEYIEFQDSVRNRTLMDAKGVTKETTEWWDKQAAKHSDSLSNDAQRRAFAQQASKMRLHSRDGMAAFEATELRKSVEASGTASIATWTNFAASQVGTPVEAAAITQAKGAILGSLGALAQSGGYAGSTPEAQAVREKKQQDALTALHLQVIQNKVDKDPAGAKAYFEANKTEINGGNHDGINGLLKAGATKDVANSFANAVMADKMSEADALALARSKLKGDELTAVVTEVKTRFSEQVQQRERGQATAGDEAYGILAKTGRLSAIPASVLAQMDGKVRLALEHDARLMAEGAQPVTDWNRYYELREMARNPATREAFLRHDLRKDYPSLGKAQREALLDMRDRLKNPEEMKDVVTLGAQLSNMHDQLGWGSSEADRKKKGAFDFAAEEAIRAEQKARGKPLNDEERKKIIDRLAIEGDTNGWMPFGNKRYYEVQGTPGAKNFVPTGAERAKIVEAIRGDNETVTDDEILKRFKKAHGLP